MIEAQGLTLRLCVTATLPAEGESEPDPAPAPELTPLAPPETPLSAIPALTRLTPGGNESDKTWVSKEKNSTLWLIALKRHEALILRANSSIKPLAVPW